MEYKNSIIRIIVGGIVIDTLFLVIFKIVVFISTTIWNFVFIGIPSGKKIPKLPVVQSCGNFRDYVPAQSLTFRSIYRHATVERSRKQTRYSVCGATTEMASPTTSKSLRDISLKK